MKKNDMLVYKNKFRTINELFNLETKFHIVAGPCSVESIEQMEQTAQLLKGNNLNFIRGGAYKPRTSPYDFQGLGLEGLKILGHIRKEYGLIVVSEILDPRDLEIVLGHVDVIQIGSRNMHNYSLLKEVGKTNHPVLLKRGMMATVEEFLNAAEYIVSNGNTNVILCERGIRTFENSTRNTLDISCIAIIKQETSLPIIADLSHSLGRTDIVFPVLKSVEAVGADGVMLELHPEPKNALSDNPQQLNHNEFMALMKSLCDNTYLVEK
jgi:3-deoxy-7-phosphoheptulonate synthase/chorismate mutase